jgi:hypothetical protein
MMGWSQAGRMVGYGIVAWIVGGPTLPRALAWTPGTGSPDAVSGFVVNPQSRMDVLAMYQTVYGASEDYAANLAWTGDVPTGAAGTKSAAFKDDVRRRINFYRALCGLPADIVFSDTKSAKCQKAALMFARNNDLDHTPPTSWVFYTADGAEAAGASNISLGSYGPDAVDGLMEDDGSGNEVVGHRRWLLYSRAQEMGTGDVPADGGFNSANAIWVIGNEKVAPTPQFVAWPNQGSTPHNLVPGRWSLSRPNANFGNATVTMTQGATNVPTTIISDVDNGYGDNTIVWVPAGIPSSVTNDLTYNITVSGITGSGVPASYSYSVTLFDPNILGDSVTIAGTSTPATAGAAYTFNSIAQADQYELQVSTASATSWTEGAEDASASLVVANVSPGYALRQTVLKRTGAKAFQLTYPSGVFSDQSFEIIRDIVPSGTSQLQFFDRARFSVTTTTFRAEVSTDNGNTWTSVFSRNGVGLDSGNWDGSWISRNVSLSAYAGQVVRLRFIMRRNGGSVTQGTGVNHGFFADDVTVTNATQLLSATSTLLAGSATSFTLNAATAGDVLVHGGEYHLRVRPNVGTRWFGYGPVKAVTAIASDLDYSDWVALVYPAVTEGPDGDHDGDGIGNGVEFALGFDPTAVDPSGAVPEVSVDENFMTLSFTPPSGLIGVTYGAEWTTDLVNWGPLTDTDAGEGYTFSRSVVGEDWMFFRHRIVVVP